MIITIEFIGLKNYILSINRKFLNQSKLVLKM